MTFSPRRWCDGNRCYLRVSNIRSVYASCNFIAVLRYSTYCNIQRAKNSSRMRQKKIPQCPTIITNRLLFLFPGFSSTNLWTFLISNLMRNSLDKPNKQPMIGNATRGRGLGVKIPVCLRRHSWDLHKTNRSLGKPM